MPQLVLLVIRYEFISTALLNCVSVRYVHCIHHSEATVLFHRSFASSISKTTIPANIRVLPSVHAQLEARILHWEKLKDSFPWIESHLGSAHIEDSQNVVEKCSPENVGSISSTCYTNRTIARQWVAGFLMDHVQRIDPEFHSSYDDSEMRSYGVAGSKVRIILIEINSSRLERHGNLLDECCVAC